jgi:hypothetical protein
MRKKMQGMRQKPRSVAFIVQNGQTEKIIDPG